MSEAEGLMLCIFQDVKKCFQCLFQGEDMYFVRPEGNLHEMSGIYHTPYFTSFTSFLQGSRATS